MLMRLRNDLTDGGCTVGSIGNRLTTWPACAGEKRTDGMGERSRCQGLLLLREADWGGEGREGGQDLDDGWGGGSIGLVGMNTLACDGSLGNSLSRCVV